MSNRTKKYMSPSFRNACLLLTAGTLAACSPEEVNIKIGVALPLSGPIAQFGKDGVNGAQIAVDELNSDRKFTINGKHPTITLVPMDDKSDPETGKQVAQALLHKKSAQSMATLIPALRFLPPPSTRRQAYRKFHHQQILSTRARASRPPSAFLLMTTCKVRRLLHC